MRVIEEAVPRLLMGFLAAILITTVMPSVAPADIGPPSVNPAEGPPGTQVTVNDFNWAADEFPLTVYIKNAGDAPYYEVLGTVPAPANCSPYFRMGCSYTLVVTIPLDAPPTGPATPDEICGTPANPAAVSPGDLDDHCAGYFTVTGTPTPQPTPSPQPTPGPNPSTTQPPITQEQSETLQEVSSCWAEYLEDRDSPGLKIGPDCTTMLEDAIAKGLEFIFPPKVTSLLVSPNATIARVKASRALTISFRVRSATTVTLTVKHVQGSAVVWAHRGLNKIAFPKLWIGHNLRRGTYTLVATTSPTVSTKSAKGRRHIAIWRNACRKFRLSTMIRFQKL